VSLSDVVPRIVPFGSLPIPTRAQLADVRTSGMQGLIVNTPSFGPGNWFELYLTSEELTAADRAEAGSYVGCIAGALSRAEYLDGLAAAGFADASVTFTNEAAPGMHSAIVRAVKPTR